MAALGQGVGKDLPPLTRLNLDIAPPSIIMKKSQNKVALDGIGPLDSCRLGRKRTHSKGRLASGLVLGCVENQSNL